MFKRVEREMFSIRRGERVAVVRPDNPDLIISEIKSLTLESLSKSEARRRFDSIMAKQAYTFVGYLSVRWKVLDGDGIVIARRPNPGDSFFTESFITKIS